MTAIVDMYPKTFRVGYRRELLILGMSVASFLVGLIMLTEVKSYCCVQTMFFPVAKYYPRFTFLRLTQSSITRSSPDGFAESMC